MIKCKNCGCTVTPEPPKKGKYIYLRPKPKNGCNCKQINEEVANKLVEDTFRAMTIPEDVLGMYPLMFPNFWLDGRKLSYDIKKPFDKSIKGANYLLKWKVGEEILTNYAYDIYEMSPYLMEMHEWLKELDRKKQKP